MLFSGALKHSLDAHGMDVGATPLPPLRLRGRSHPIDIFCVPLQARMQVSARPVSA
jgi:adenylate cyclase